MREYLDLLGRIMEHGSDRPDRTGVGTKALFGETMKFDMRDGFPAMTTKKLAFEVVKAELLWFLRGSSDVRELQRLGCHIWDLNAEASYWKPKARFDGDVGLIYGPQWRGWSNPEGEPIDQIDNVIQQIKKDPYSRRHVVTAWNPADLDKAALPPCHLCFQFFVDGNELSLLMYQRSADMFLGVPFNIASYALLLRMVAQVTKLEPGKLTHHLGDAHIYRSHFDQVRRQLSRKPMPLPRLWLNPVITSIDDFTMDDIELVGYQCHAAIRAKMAV